jgi:predicted methyltransferase
MNKSIYASLKPGGQFAVIDFVARPGSKLPPGVPANRGGNGIRPELVVEEVPKAGFKHIRTITDWPAPDGGYFLVLFTKP